MVCRREGEEEEEKVEGIRAWEIRIEAENGRARRAGTVLK